MPGESMNRWSCASTTPSRSTGTGPVTLTTWLPATGTSCCTWTPGHRTGAGGSHTARASGIVDADTTGGPDAQPRHVPRIDRWTVLGQSFGGFTSLTYLSFAPEGLAGALLTGGLSPVGRPVDDVYAATYHRAQEANARYFARYPDDRPRVRTIHRR